MLGGEVVHDRLEGSGVRHGPARYRSAPTRRWAVACSGDGRDRRARGPIRAIDRPAREHGRLLAYAEEMAGEWLDALEMDAWRGFMRAHARLLSRLDAALQSSQGLSLADYEVLVHLSEASGDQLRMCELAEKLTISPSGLTRRLDGLVAGGMVVRIRCVEDRRGTYAALTPLGRRRLEESAPYHVAHVRRFFVDRLSRKQLSALVAAMGPLSEELVVL